MLESHPEWWEWDLEITPHVEKRMEQRDFTEIDLRRMLDSANRIRKDSLEGRWIVETTHRGTNWEVILEPDVEDTLLVVVTAFTSGAQL